MLAALALSQAAAAPSLAIMSVNVIDVSAPTPATALLANRTVVITGNHVTAIEPAGRHRRSCQRPAHRRPRQIPYPRSVDMHTHAFAEHEWAFPLFVANGVTGIREMGTVLSYERINRVRRGVAEGTIVGPRIGAATARVLDGIGGRGGPMTPVATADEGRRLVREYKQNGIDFVKPYNLLERETYLAIVDEARRQGLPVSGHVPISVSATEASDAGQIGIEHMWDLLVSSSHDETALRQERSELAETPVSGSVSANRDQSRRDVRRTKGVRGVHPLGEQSHGRHSHAGFLRGDDQERERACKRRAAETCADGTRERWQQQVMQRPSAQAQRQAPVLQKRAEAVRSMHEHGVRLLSGTDLTFTRSPDSACMTSSAGSPKPACHHSTFFASPRSTRHSFWTRQDMGSVSPGKLADMMLLDANPLQDIGHARRIAAVIVNGHLYGRAALDTILANVH